MSSWYDDEQRVRLGEVTLSVHVRGEGPLVVLCHGFPELGYSWRLQVPALVAAGYRVAVPDMRGYGRSSRPEPVGSYDADALAGDVAGLVEHLGERSAVLVGHDWGASVVWHTARAHPARVRAVAGLSVPPARRPPVPPLEILARRHGTDHYLVWFQQPGVADAALARDLRRTLTATRVLDEVWARSEHRDPLPPWWSEDDLAVYVEAFGRTGFTPGLAYYRNMDRNWELSERFGDRPIEQPSFFATGSEDMVAQVMDHRRLAEVLADLRGAHVIDGAGHWLMQERPDEVNRLLLGFLGGLGDG